MCRTCCRLPWNDSWNLQYPGLKSRIPPHVLIYMSPSHQAQLSPSQYSKANSIFKRSDPDFYSRYLHPSQSRPSTSSITPPTEPLILSTCTLRRMAKQERYTLPIMRPPTCLYHPCNQPQTPTQHDRLQKGKERSNPPANVGLISTI